MVGISENEWLGRIQGKGPWRSQLFEARCLLPANYLDVPDLQSGGDAVANGGPLARGRRVASPVTARGTERLFYRSNRVVGALSGGTDLRRPRPTRPRSAADAALMAGPATVMTGNVRRIPGQTTP